MNRQWTSSLQAYRDCLDRFGRGDYRTDKARLDLVNAIKEGTRSFYSEVYPEKPITMNNVLEYTFGTVPNWLVCFVRFHIGSLYNLLTESGVYEGEPLERVEVGGVSRYRSLRYPEVYFSHTARSDISLMINLPDLYDKRLAEVASVILAHGNFSMYDGIPRSIGIKLKPYEIPYTDHLLHLFGKLFLCCGRKRSEDWV